jgi:hypothetical protein
MVEANRWDVISPDGLSIESDVLYATEEEAFAAFNEWLKRYESQGYYSSPYYGRIPYADIQLYCSVVLWPPKAN